MDWSLADLVVFAGMLGAITGALALAFRRAPNRRYRAAAAVALLAAFLLCWANGAVGIIGSENNDANLMFAAVLALAVIGAAVARFKPRGMMRAMVATAAAQVLVGVIALLASAGTEGNRWPWDVIVATAFFAALWLTAGWLFRRAAAGAARATA